MQIELYIIKTHGSESRDQEGTKRTPNQKNATTTVSLLHDRTVLQFSKILHHYFKIHKVKSQTHEGFTLHKTFVSVLYTIRSFRAVCAIAS